METELTLIEDRMLTDIFEVEALEKRYELGWINPKPESPFDIEPPVEFYI